MSVTPLSPSLPLHACTTYLECAMVLILETAVPAARHFHTYDVQDQGRMTFILGLYLYKTAVGEVGGMPKLGQSRKSRLRRHGKEWTKYVHGNLKL